MTVIVNMHQAKTQLSKLVERARLGEEVIIARDGEPMVQLTPVKVRSKKRPLGLLAGKIVVADNFNDPLPDEFMEAFL